MNSEISKVKIDKDLQAALQKSDENEAKLRHLKETAQGDLWALIQKKYEIDWTYHSNAIEGSSLSRGETQFFLEEGLTVEGKPLKDFLDAKNHAEAIDTLFDVIKTNRDISESLMKELNALLLKGIEHTPATTQSGKPIQKKATPGHYKIQPNHVLKPDGALHKYSDPLQVPSEMSVLIKWISSAIDTEHPIITAGISHYHFVKIHPFDDGNGRGARLLMNLILMRKQYSPIIIPIETRRHYLDTLSLADQGDLLSFLKFLAATHTTSQETILQHQPK